MDENKKIKLLSIAIICILCSFSFSAVAYSEDKALDTVTSKDGKYAIDIMVELPRITHDVYRPFIEYMAIDKEDVLASLLDCEYILINDKENVHYSYRRVADKSNVVFTYVEPLPYFIAKEYNYDYDYLVIEHSGQLMYMKYVELGIKSHEPEDIMSIISELFDDEMLNNAIAETTSNSYQYIYKDTPVEDMFFKIEDNQVEISWCTLRDSDKFDIINAKTAIQLLAENGIKGDAVDVQLVYSSVFSKNYAQYMDPSWNIILLDGSMYKINAINGELYEKQYE